MSLFLENNPDTLRKTFEELSTPRDVAAMLDIEYAILVYHLYKSQKKRLYKSFNIPKKSGGIRTISAPITALKIIQRKLNQILQAVYKVKPSVHGFVLSRNVVTNAKGHLRKKYVLNIDLKDFFSSINFGRVRGMFMGIPYLRNPKVATILAQICCFDNALPQGAPTSPVVSNMICAKMDSQLQRLANKYKCFYTRYADDITISTPRSKFPISFVSNEKVGDSYQIQIGESLLSVIESNSFAVNYSKVYLRSSSKRQEVTGIITNIKPNLRRKYINQIRAMLHAWEKYGLKKAEKEFNNQIL